MKSDIEIIERVEILPDDKARRVLNTAQGVN